MSGCHIQEMERQVDQGMKMSQERVYLCIKSALVGGLIASAFWVLFHRGDSERDTKRGANLGVQLMMNNLNAGNRSVDMSWIESNAWEIAYHRQESKVK